MYTLLSTIAANRLWTRQLPIFALALVIAETQYRFHSFTLECLAFLATWFALDFAVERVLRRR